MPARLVLVFKRIKLSCLFTPDILLSPLCHKVNSANKGIFAQNEGRAAGPHYFLLYRTSSKNNLIYFKVSL